MRLYDGIIRPRPDSKTYMNIHFSQDMISNQTHKTAMLILIHDLTSNCLEKDPCWNQYFMGKYGKENDRNENKCVSFSEEYGCVNHCIVTMRFAEKC